MQATFGGVVLELIQNVSLFALVAAGYAALRRGTNLSSAKLSPVIGLLFGCGALLAMTFRIEISSGVYVDGRSIMASLSTAFGGPVAGAVTLVMILAYRLWLAGAGTLSGMIAAVLAAAIGYVFRWRWQQRNVKADSGRLLTMGVLVVAAGSGTFALFNPAAAPETIFATGLPLLLVIPLGTVILGLALQSEDDRRALEARLAEQAGLLETVFRSMGEGVVVADNKGEIVLANPVANQLAGISVSGSNGPRRIGQAGALRTDGVTPFATDELPLARAVAGIATNGVEMFVRGTDQQLHLVNTSARPLVDGQGERRGGVVVFHDVTVERKLEERLRRNEQRFLEAVNAMGNGFALFDAEDRLVAYNDGFMNEEQRSRFGDPLGHTFTELTRAFANDALSAVDAQLDGEAWQRWRLDVHRNPPAQPVEIQWTDGRWMRVMERRTAEGGYVGVWTDITAVKAAEARLRDAIESIPEGFILLDKEFNVVIFNRRFLALYPRTAPSVHVGAAFEDILRYGARHGEYPAVSSHAEVEDFVDQWMPRFTSAEPFFGEGAFSDGRWVLVSHRRTASGDYASIRTDITAQKQRERELANLLQELIASQAAAERAHAETKRMSDTLLEITDAVPALVAHLDHDQRYTYCNKEYQDVFGIDPTTLIGKTVAEAVPSEIYEVVKPHIKAAFAGHEAAFIRPMITEREGQREIRYVEQRYIPDRDPDGKVEGLYAIAWDITDSHRREQVLNKEASTDALTGLLNRRAMMQVIEETGAGWAAGTLHGAILFLDVDKFKQINDTLGHDVGDELLKTFAERIRSVVRASDKVARLGGDEFVILLSAREAEDVARRIAATLLDRVRQPIEIGGRELRISTSIGVAVASGPEPSPARLLKEADLALYEAKAAGRDGYAVRRIDPQAASAEP